MLIHPTQVGFIDSQTNFNGGDVEVYKGDTQTSGSATWSDLNNGRFYFSGNVTIENTVTIEEGARFEMGTDTKLVVTEGSSHTGILKAIGTSSESIVFTGRAKAKGAWGGILINSGSVENEMDYVTIRYGGGTDLATYMDAGNLGVYNESYLKISNSTIEHSANYGLIVRTGRNASVTKNNVTFANNDNTDEYSY